MISRDRHARSSRTAPNPRNHSAPLSEVDHINQHVMRTIWMVHNHPSGDPTPSRADIDMTKQVIEAARALSVQVHDHLIVGRDGVASFKQLGLM